MLFLCISFELTVHLYLEPEKKNRKFIIEHCLLLFFFLRKGLTIESIVITRDVVYFPRQTTNLHVSFHHYCNSVSKQNVNRIKIFVRVFLLEHNYRGVFKVEFLSEYMNPTLNF